MLALLLGSSILAAEPVAEETLLPAGPGGLVWEAPLAVGAEVDAGYEAAVEALLAEYESSVGRRLTPGPRGKTALKVNTRGGRGLSTPRALLSGMIAALEARGFSRDSILIVDYSEFTLRRAGILPPLSHERSRFEGCPVIALDAEASFDPDWFYDSPLPPSLRQEPDLINSVGIGATLEAGDEARKSFLPMPLMFEVDFWINLAVAVDDPALGVDGALANATLWSVSNSHRFLANPATASAAIAEIAAIPELRERMILHFVSLEKYQFVGGPFFKSIYSRSEPKLWMSGDPVALDRLMYDRMNAHRLLQGLPEIDPMPRQLAYAASLGLGEFMRSRIRIKEVEMGGIEENAEPMFPGPDPVNAFEDSEQ